MGSWAAAAASCGMCAQRRMAVDVILYLGQGTARSAVAQCAGVGGHCVCSCACAAASGICLIFTCPALRARLVSSPKLGRGQAKQQISRL